MSKMGQLVIQANECPYRDECEPCTLLTELKCCKEDKLWDVWSEGFAATGERGGAFLLGTAKAKTFKEACISVAAKLSQPNLFNESQLTYWACRLYDNETDARKAFG